MRKRNILIATLIMTIISAAAGFSSTSTSTSLSFEWDDSDLFNDDDWFEDDFFNSDSEESQEEESENEESLFEDDWFEDDFFNEESSEEETSNGEENNQTDEDSDEDSTNESEVTEEAYILEAPEPGEEWYEAGSDEWVSYVNPRDEYKRDYASYQGEGSGKICVTLLNEDEEVIAGETLPDTQITVPTGESLDWHPHASPFTVDLPLTENYERPLDSDQFGTSPDVVQGDGYIDSHCLEWHDLADDATIEYDEAEITGAHADDLEVVGYIQQSHEAWDTDVDPIEDAESYDEAGGEWTMHEDGSHGQVVVVLQLDR